MVPIVGICRFSFFGRGDWHAWSAVDGKPGAPADLQAHAARLYAPARMEQRFWSFENLLLRAILSQTDRDFHFIVLTSTVMPQIYLDRLRDLVAGHPKVHLVISDTATVNEGVLPTLAHIRGDAPGLVQFRIDDDDCLSVDYIAKLADYIRRMQGFGPFSYSRSQGLVLTAYSGAAPQYFTLKLPFHSMGTAVYLPSSSQTVFSFGHLALQARFPSFLDGRGTAFLALKLPGHDSQPMDDRGHKPRGMNAITDQEFATHLARDFPYLDAPALVTWASAQLVDQPAA
jgi:hypothetical protein